MNIKEELLEYKNSNKSNPLMDNILIAVLLPAMFELNIVSNDLIFESLKYGTIPPMSKQTPLIRLATLSSECLKPNLLKSNSLIAFEEASKNFESEESNPLIKS